MRATSHQTRGASRPGGGSKLNAAVAAPARRRLQTLVHAVVAAAVCVAAAALSMPAVTSAQAPASGDSEPLCMPALPEHERPPLIDGAATLVVGASNWRSSMVASHVAAIYLRERAGTPAVVEVDTDPDLGHIVRRLATGDVHVVLEAWPNMRAVAAEPGVSETIDSLTTLGPTARVGWYFPTRMLSTHPWLADFDGMDAATRATLGRDVFGNATIGGPATWASEEACRPGGIFENLGYGLDCTRVDTEDELLSELETRYAAGDAFLIYLWRPLHVFASYDLTRAKLPCNDPACYAALACDYPSTELHKLAWSQVPLAFSPLAVNFLERFELGVDVVEDVAALAGVATSDAIAAAACTWLGANAATIEGQVDQDRVLFISTVSPPVIAARGGTTLTIAGTGFGIAPPPVFVADVDGVPCLETRWVSMFEAECVAPPGAGQGVDVTLRAGPSNVVKAEAAVSYEAASLHRVAFRAGPAASRSASAGEQLVVLGDNFVRERSQCRIGGIAVQATFLNFTAVVCVVPAVPPAAGTVVTIEVTNDGQRWVSGIELVPVSQMVWHGGVVGSTPADYSALTAPAEVVVVAAFENAADASTAVARVAVSHVNADAALLPFTTLRLVQAHIAHVLDLDPSQRETALSAVITGLQASEAPVVGVVGSGFSSVTMPMAAASARARTPWAQVSHAATIPALSNTSRFPHFVRTVSSDDAVVAGIIEIMGVLADALLLNNLIDAESRAVGMAVAEDDAFSAAMAEAFLAQATAAGFVVAPIVSFAQRDVPAHAAQARAFVASTLQPLSPAASDVRVVFWALNFFDNTADIVAGAADAGVADSAHLLLSGDQRTAAALPFSLLVSSVDGPASHPLRDEIQAYLDTHLSGGGDTPGDGDAEAPGAASEVAWPLGIYDAVFALARAVDHLVPLKRSAEGADYTNGAEVTDVLRRHSSQWPSVSGYGGFQLGTNDPRTPEMSVWTYNAGLETRVGEVRGGIVVLQDDIVLPNGAGFRFVPPTNVTIGVAYRGPGPPPAGDLFAAAGLAAGATYLNGLVAGGRGDGRNPPTASWVANAMLHLDLVDVSDTSGGGVAAGLERLLARAAAHPAGAQHKLVGVVTLNSEATLAVLPHAAERNLAVLSPSATLDSLSDAEEYPSFARVVAGDSYQANAMADLVSRMGWRTVATVYIHDEPYAAGLEAEFAAAAAPLELNIAHRVGVSRDDGAETVRGALQATVVDDVRVFVLFALAQHACAVVVAAAATTPAVIGDGAHVWIGADGWIGATLCDDDGDGDGGGGADAVIASAEGSVGTQPARVQRVNADAHVGRIEAAVLRDPSLLPTADQRLGGDAVVGGDDALLTAFESWRDAQAALFAPTDAGGSSSGSAAGDGPQPPAPAELFLHFKAFRGFDLALVTSDVVARMTASTQDVRRGRELLSFWRRTSGVVGVSQSYVYAEGDNSPVFAPHALVSRRGATAHTFAAVDIGLHTERGFVDLAGCPAGYQRASAAESCEPCPKNTYKDSVGDFECDPCPSRGAIRTTTDGAEGASRRDMCLCPGGTVMGVDPAFPEFPCVECPPGALCLSTGLRPSGMLNRVGWWRGDPLSMVFAPCLDASKCTRVGLTLPANDTVVLLGDGGDDDTASALDGVLGAVGAAADELALGTRARAAYVGGWTHTTPCTDGYSGPLCEICVAGFGRTGAGVCAPCGDAHLVRLALAATLVGVVAIVLWTAYLQLPAEADMAEGRRTSNTKLLTTVMQVNGIFNVYSLAWPPIVEALFKVQGQVSTVSTTFLSIDCLLDDVRASAARASFVSYFWAPPVVVGVALVAWALGASVRCAVRACAARGRRMRRAGRAVRHHTATTTRAATVAAEAAEAGEAGEAEEQWRLSQPTLLDIWGDVVMHTFNVAVFFLYPALVSTMLWPFDCVGVPSEGGERRYLRLDFKVACDESFDGGDGVYGGMWRLGVLGLCVYVVGIPVAYGVVLTLYRSSLFVYSATGALYPAITPLRLVTLGDAHALGTALTRVRRGRMWASVAGAKVIGVDLDDLRVTMSLKSKHRVFARNTKLVRMLFDDVASELCHMLALSESSVFGGGVRVWEPPVEDAVQALVAQINASMRHKGSDSSSSSSSDGDDGDDANGGGHSGGIGSGGGDVEMARHTGGGGAGNGGHSSSWLGQPLSDATAHPLFTDTAPPAAEGTAHPTGKATEPRAGSATPASARAGNATGGDGDGGTGKESGGDGGWTAASAAFTPTELDVRRDQLRRVLRLLDACYDDTCMAVVTGRTTVMASLEYAADKSARVSAMQRRFGFLFLTYTQTAVAFELALTLFKAGIAAIGVLLASEGATAQVAMGALMCLVMLAVLHSLSPMVSYSLYSPSRLYLTPAARVIRDFVAVWKSHHKGPSASASVSSAGDLWIVVRNKQLSRALRDKPAHVWVPEVLTTTALAYCAFWVTTFNLMMGTVADARRSTVRAAGGDPLFDGTLIGVSAVVVVVNVGVMSAFAAAIAADYVTELQAQWAASDVRRWWEARRRRGGDSGGGGGGGRDAPGDTRVVPLHGVGGRAVKVTAGAEAEAEAGPQWLAGAAHDDGGDYDRGGGGGGGAHVGLFASAPEDASLSRAQQARGGHRAQATPTQRHSGRGSEATSHTATGRSAAGGAVALAGAGAGAVTAHVTVGDGERARKGPRRLPAL